MRLVIVLFLSISSCLAASFDHCTQQGEKYGDGKGGDSISSTCLDLVQSSEIYSEDGTYKVMGLSNILVTKDFSTSEIKSISGMSSRLIDISQIHFDSSVMKTLVYSKGNKYLLTFKSHLYGNIAPTYRFELKDLEAEVSQVLQLSGAGLNAVLLENNEIRFYLEKAMEYAHKPENVTKVKFKLVDKEGAFGKINSIGADIAKGLLILNTEKGKFSVEIEKLPAVVIKSVL